MKNLNKFKKHNISINNQSTKYTASQTEANEEKFHEDYIHNYALTESSNYQSNLLDYIFVNNKNLIKTHTKDQSKIKTYYQDLEHTLEINLDILFRLDYNFKNNEQTEEIKSLIKNIIEKNKIKIENIKKQKELKSSLFNKKQAINEMKIKNIESKETLIKREKNDIELLNNKKKYIKKMYNNISDLEDYLQILKLKTEIKNGSIFNNINNQKHEITLSEFFRKNTNIMREIKLYKSDIQKLTNELIELKKDNQLYLEETKLYKAKNPNKDLIRVMEFYRRIIRSLQTKIKILRNSFDNMTKTLNYLNLGDIVNFNIFKKDLNTTHYEIDLNDLHDDESNDFDLHEKINSLMNFKKYIK